MVQADHEISKRSNDGTFALELAAEEAETVRLVRAGSPRAEAAACAIQLSQDNEQPSLAETFRAYPPQVCTACHGPVQLHTKCTVSSADMEV